MRIKICGLFRDEDIDYVNEAQADYAGFIFAKSSREVSPPLAQYLRFRLSEKITPVGVFVNAPIALITELYHNGVISIAQLHGNEDASYITQLKKSSKTTIRQNSIPPIKVIKTVLFGDESFGRQIKKLAPVADYFLIDSGAGSGKTFDWSKLGSVKIPRPWFLAGGINIKNIEQAMELNPLAIDVSSGAETDGVKDRKKILELVETIRQG